MTPPAASTDEGGARRHLNAFEMVSLLEPHKQFQNSVTMLRKRVHGQHEPIYSNFP